MLIFLLCHFNNNNNNTNNDNNNIKGIDLFYGFVCFHTGTVKLQQR